MKRFLLLSSTFILIYSCVLAQSPLYIPYQAVARNAAGNLLVNQAVNLRFTVQQSTSGGSTLYQETQSTTTNSLGLFNVNIGNGTPTSGTFSGITWGDGQPKFMEVEIDPNGSGYVNMGSTQMMSVPYALYAGSAGSVGTIPTGTAGQTLYNNSGTWTATSNLYNNGTNVGIGNSSPNSGAILDLTNSSNKGLMPPSTTSPPATPSAGMVFYNSTSGCMEYYSTLGWVNIGCPCSTTSGGLSVSSISGATTVMANQTVTYSISAVTGASNYAWSITGLSGTGSAAVSGSGPSCTVTFTGTVGNITTMTLNVAVSNSCGNTPAIATAAITSGGKQEFNFGSHTQVESSSLTWQFSCPAAVTSVFVKLWGAGGGCTGGGGGFVSGTMAVSSSHNPYIIIVGQGGYTSSSTQETGGGGLSYSGGNGGGRSAIRTSMTSADLVTAGGGGGGNGCSNGEPGGGGGAATSGGTAGSSSIGSSCNCAAAVSGGSTSGGCPPTSTCSGNTYASNYGSTSAPNSSSYFGGCGVYNGASTTMIGTIGGNGASKGAAGGGGGYYGGGGGDESSGAGGGSNFLGVLTGTTSIQGGTYTISGSVKAPAANNGDIDYASGTATSNSSSTCGQGGNNCGDGGDGYVIIEY